MRNSSMVKDIKRNQFFLLSNDHHRFVLFKIVNSRLIYLRKFDVFNVISNVYVTYSNSVVYVTVVYKDKNVTVFNIDFDNILLRTVAMLNFEHNLNILPVLDYHRKSLKNFVLYDESYQPSGVAIIENNNTLYIFRQNNTKALEWLFKKNIKSALNSKLIEFIPNVHQTNSFVSLYSIKINIKDIIKHNIRDLCVGLRNQDIVVSVLHRKPVATLVANNSKIENYNDALSTFVLNPHNLGLLITEKEDLMKMDSLLKAHGRLIENIKPDINEFIVVDQQRNFYAFNCRGYICLIDEAFHTVIVYDELIFNKLSNVIAPSNLLHVKLYGCSTSMFRFFFRNNKIFIENGVSTLILSQANNTWNIFSLIPLVPIHDIDFENSKIIYETDNEIIFDSFIYAEQNSLPQSNIISCFYFLDVTRSLYFTDSPNVLLSRFEDKSAVTRCYTKKIEFEHKLPLVMDWKCDTEINVTRIWHIPKNDQLIVLYEQKLGVYKIGNNKLELTSEVPGTGYSDELCLFVNFPYVDKFTIVKDNKITIRSLLNVDLEAEHEMEKPLTSLSAIGNSIFGLSNDGSAIKITMNSDLDKNEAIVEIQPFIKIVEYNDKIYVLTRENKLEIYDFSFNLISRLNFKQFAHVIDPRTDLNSYIYSLTDPSVALNKVNKEMNIEITDFNICSYVDELYMIFMLNNGKVMLYKYINEVAILIPHEYVNIAHSRKDFKFEIIQFEDMFFISIYNEKMLLLRKKFNTDILEEFSTFPALGGFVSNEILYLIGKSTVRKYNKINKLSTLEFKETVKSVTRAKIESEVLYIINKCINNETVVHVHGEDGKYIDKILPNKNEYINFIEILDKNTKSGKVILFLGIVSYLPNSNDFIAKWRIYTLQNANMKLDIRLSVDQSFQEQNQRICGVADFDDTLLIVVDKRIIQIELNKITKVIDTELNTVSSLAVSNGHVIIADTTGYVNYYYFDDTNKSLQPRGSLLLSSAAKFIKFIENVKDKDSEVFLILTENLDIEFYKFFQKSIMGSKVTFLDRLQRLSVRDTVEPLQNTSNLRPELLLENYGLLRFIKVEHEIFEVLKSLYKYISHQFPFIGGFSPLYCMSRRRTELWKSTSFAILDYRVFDMYISFSEVLLQHINDETGYNYSKVCNRLNAIRNVQETN